MGQEVLNLKRVSELALLVVAIGVATQPAAVACTVDAQCSTNDADWFAWVPRYIGYNVLFRGVETGFGDLEITKREWDYGDDTGWHEVGADGRGSCAYSHMGAKTATYRVTVVGEQTFQDSCEVTVFDIMRNGDLWYFDGGDPANYLIEITWTAVGAGSTGSFYWEIIDGEDEADWENDSDEVERENDNDVGMKSTKASEPSGGGVTFRFEYENPAKNDTVFMVFTGDPTIYAPKSLQYLDTAHDDYSNGYSSHVYYATLDQFGNTLPYDVELNEEWTTADISDWPQENWTRADPTGAMWSPEEWYDSIYIHGENWYPKPQNLNVPLGDEKVDHWGQAFHVGSVTPGDGVHVHTNTLQSWRDHGDHTDLQ